MKEESGIEINDILEEHHFANGGGNASPIPNAVISSNDDAGDGGSLAAHSDDASIVVGAKQGGWGRLGMKTKVVIASSTAFLVALTICLGVGVEAKIKASSSTTSNAFALQDGNDVPVPTRMIGISTELDKDVWERHRRYLVDVGGFCGGTLISPRAVLTAAHCGDFGPGFELRLNMYDKSRPEDANFTPYEMCPAVNATEPCDINTKAYIIQHYGYAIKLPSGLDLAVIILPEGRPATGIPIVPLNRDPTVPFNNQELETFGWGSTTYAEAPGDSPTKPRTAKFRYVPPQKCKAPAGTHPDPAMDSTLCAWAAGSAVGAGDSGGPIVIVGPTGETIQVGVVSEGEFPEVAGSETTTEWPDRYARISFGYSWIKETICREVPDDKVFCAGRKGSKQAKRM